MSARPLGRAAFVGKQFNKIQLNKVDFAKQNIKLICLT